MRLFVMRHGETAWNRERRIQGMQNIPLHPDGREQVRQACRKLMERERLRPVRIFTSPLLRAAQSALIASEMFQVPLEIMPCMRERSFGLLEGLTWQQIEERYGIADAEEIRDGDWEVEELTTVGRRVAEGLASLSAAYPHEEILLVTHGSIIKSMGRVYGREVGILPNAASLELLIPARTTIG